MQKFSICSKKNSGMVLAEMLVATLLGVLVIGLTLGTTMTVNELEKNDRERLEQNHEIRSGLEFVLNAIKMTGENLPESFPAIIINNGSESDPDEIILRRAKIGEVLGICSDLAASSPRTSFVFANLSGASGCAAADNTTNYTAWETQRIAEGGDYSIFVYSTTARTGEFVNYTGEAQLGNEMWLNFSGGTWAREYVVGTAAAYFLEETKFRLQGDVLQMVINEDESGVQNIVSGITGFQASVTRSDSTERHDYNLAVDSDDIWANTEWVTIQISNELYNITDRSIPRNVFSVSVDGTEI